MFGDFDGSKDPNPATPASNPDPPFPNRELTLSSYLCDKPGPLTSTAAAAAGPSSPPNPAPPSDDAKLCVERDFLHLSGPKRGEPPGDDSSVVGGKKPRLDSLQLSLSLPSDAPALPSSQPHSQLSSLLPSAAPPADGDLRGGATAAAAVPPPRRTYSATTARTRSINPSRRSASSSARVHLSGRKKNGVLH